MKDRIVILGAGESGLGAAILAVEKGHSVMLSDAGKIKPTVKEALCDYSIAFEEGGHSDDLLQNADLVIKSPGIPDTALIIQQAEQIGLPVISEIEFAARYTNAKLIGISGSNGKTTTSLLLYHVLKGAGLDVCLAGNIGDSFAKAIAVRDHDYFVLELSSFQLDRMYDTKLDIAILLNITPDHLDRYDYKFENYVASKFRLSQNQSAGDFFIYNNDDPVISEHFGFFKGKPKYVPFSIKKESHYGASLKGQMLTLNMNQNSFKMTIDELALVGKHNLYNSMAASIASKLINVRNESLRKCLSDFQNEAHRLEEVATIDGIKYINDSKATNVNSVWYALESMSSKVVWIAGGIDKGNDYSELLELVQKKVDTLICLGKDNAALINSFSSFVSKIEVTECMEEAVRMAKEVAVAGDTVLLSPACASFDLFENYEERGNCFKNIVKSL